MYSRKRRRLTNEINVVPYIDVMLVLLVIFMITAPLLTTGVDVNLPQVAGKPMNFNQNNQPIVLTVTRQGQMSLNVGNHPDQPLSPQQVTQTAAKFIRLRPNAPVAVKGDGGGTYASVVRGMVLLQKAGARQVGLLTKNINFQNNKKANAQGAR